MTVAWGKCIGLLQAATDGGLLRPAILINAAVDAVLRMRCGSVNMCSGILVCPTCRTDKCEFEYSIGSDGTEKWYYIRPSKCSVRPGDYRRW